MIAPPFPRAVLFDLLTALIDSWVLWNAVAGSPAHGRAWRAEYLRLTYGNAQLPTTSPLLLDRCYHSRGKYLD